MRYSTWDEVILKVEDKFGYSDKYYTKLKVIILGVDYNSSGDCAQYLCYVPPYERVPYQFKTFTINKYHITNFDCDPKFLGEEGCLISAWTPTYKHIPAVEGEHCSRCRTWFEGVEKVDNKFTCKSCRDNPYR